MSIDMPKPATALLRKLEGWSTETTVGSGELAFGGLSEEPNADGKRNRISTVETVDSVLVRAVHVDRRALVAMWIRRPGAGWKFDMAWRGRAPGELAPQQVNSRELAAYVAPTFALERAA